MPVKIIKLKEPLLIDNGTGSKPGLRILPIGTIMYQDDASDLYTVFFNHEGGLDFDMMDERHCDSIEPIRLTKLTKEEILRRSEQFPLTKSDVAAVINSGGLTRDDLADIVRSMISK